MVPAEHARRVRGVGRHRLADGGAGVGLPAVDGVAPAVGQDVVAQHAARVVTELAVLARALVSCPSIESSGGVCPFELLT